MQTKWKECNFIYLKLHPIFKNTSICSKGIIKMYTNDTQASEEPRIIHTSVDYKMALEWAPAVFASTELPFFKKHIRHRCRSRSMLHLFPSFLYLITPILSFHSPNSQDPAPGIIPLYFPIFACTTDLQCEARRSPAQETLGRGTCCSACEGRERPYTDWSRCDLIIDVVSINKCF